MDPKNPTVEHSYFIELKGNSPGRVVCGTDISKPEGWQSLSAANTSEQAHVVVSSNTVNNKITFTIWLVPEQKVFKVQSFWMNASSMADKDSLELLSMARAQEKLGHKFNSALLYTTALQLSNRGPDFQLGISQSISEQASKVALPPEISGQPPYLWKDGDTTYKVLALGPIAIAGKIYLTINHETAPWGSNEEVDNRNKALMKFFKQLFPEYSDVFAGLVIRAHERGTNRGFGTVEDLAARK